MDIVGFNLVMMAKNYYWRALKAFKLLILRLIKIKL
jgi:hypothetical protein